jgi:xanthine/uracil/vitamin C permease (AzgA family)
VGPLNTGGISLAIFGLILIGALMIRRIKGTILIGIIVTSLIWFITGISEASAALVSLPPSISPVFLHLDIFGALTWGFFAGSLPCLPWICWISMACSSVRLQGQVSWMKTETFQTLKNRFSPMLLPRYSPDWQAQRPRISSLRQILRKVAELD